MNPMIITAPVNEPLTLAETKARLSIPDSDTHSDTNLEGYIKAAREEAEGFLQRSLITQTLEMALDAFPTSERILLVQGPVQSITSIKYTDSDHAEQALSSDDYSLDLYHDRVVLDYDASWPSTATVDNAVRVRYAAGWGDDGTDLPEAIRQAITLLVGHWLRFQKVAESGLGPTRIPYQFYDLLHFHRRMPI